MIVPCASFTIGFEGALLVAFANKGGLGLFAGVVFVFLTNTSTLKFLSSCPNSSAAKLA